MSNTHATTETQINAYFLREGLPYTVADVIRVRDMQVGGRKLSMQRQADELGGISRTTLYSWHRKLDTVTHA